jgi:hypothetical protein
MKGMGSVHLLGRQPYLRTNRASVSCVWLHMCVGPSQEIQQKQVSVIEDYPEGKMDTVAQHHHVGTHLLKPARLAKKRLSCHCRYSVLLPVKLS